MSLYTRAPGVERVKIKVYPKRCNDSYFHVTLPADTRPTRTAATGSATDPCYADFFRRADSTQTADMLTAAIQVVA